MKRLRNPKIERQTEAEQRHDRLYHPGIVLVYRHRRIYLGVGSTDSVTVFTEVKRIYVLAVNRRHNYAGLTVYDIEEKEKQWSKFDKIELTSGWSHSGEVFCQNDGELPEGFFDWKESKMVNYLIDFT